MTDPSTSARIGARLREARFSRGLTQHDLAQRLGTSRAALANYEAGRRALPAEVLIQVAHITEKPLSYFDPEGARRVSSTHTEAVDTIVATLEARPDVIPQVLQLLERALVEPPVTAADSG